MTARFGRNKRRRAREQIAALTQQNEQATEAMSAVLDALRKESQALHAIREEVARAKRIAGPYSVLFGPAATVKHDGKPGDSVFLDAGPRRFPMAALEAADARAMKFQRVELDVLLESVSEDWLNHAVHAKVQYRDGAAAYGIALSTLRHASMDDVTSIVAREMLPRMVNLIVRKSRGLG